jgi:hypothetical protein
LPLGGSINSHDRAEMMITWALLIPIFCLSSANQAAITSDDRDILITTPGGANGSVIVDGSVDLKKMLTNYGILSSSIDALSGSMQEALALNGEQDVCE